MKQFFTTLALAATMIFAGIETKAQNATEIDPQVYGNKVIVDYTLDKATDIDLYVSVDGGATWEGPLKCVTGNVGKNVQPGRNSIIWDPIKERGGISGDAMFQIRLPQVANTTTTYTPQGNGSSLISIMKSSKVGEQYVIEYKLDERAPHVGLYYSEDNGKTWKKAKNIAGDIYNVWPSESRQLTWDYTKETSQSSVLSFKLAILQKDEIDKAYRNDLEKREKDIEKREFAKNNSGMYYYDNGRLLRRFNVNQWFVQPEAGVGFNVRSGSNYSHLSLNFNCIVGYQIVRPLGIGLKVGYNYNSNEYHSMPIALNIRGFLGKKQTCMYYNVGVGYMANLKGYVINYDTYYEKGYEKEYVSGLLLSAEIGLAIKNFNVGVEYSFTNYHEYREYDKYKYSGDTYTFVKHVSYYDKEASHILMLKFSYNIPLWKKQ